MSRARPCPPARGLGPGRKAACTTTTIVAGIDEAGYGPLLGPLVMAASAYRLEPGASEDDLHSLLDDKAQQSQGLPTADSKQIYRGRRSGRHDQRGEQHSGKSGERIGVGRGLEAIELSTYGHLFLAHGAAPTTVAELLQHAIDLPAHELAEIPWYADRFGKTALPRHGTSDAVAGRAEQHRDWLSQRGARFAELILAPVLVPRFNRLTSAAGSKAVTLFSTTCQLIEALIERFPQDDLVIHIDRQGGRIHYAEVMQANFPMAPVDVVSEARAKSSYVLHWPGRSPVAIDFSIKADSSYAPVAAASIAAKTLRELFMDSFCSWFCERLDGLAPTAGYGTDGRRFLNEITELLRAESIPADQVERCR